MKYEKNIKYCIKQLFNIDFADLTKMILPVNKGGKGSKL
jgi:hypothetical protein